MSIEEQVHLTLFNRKGYKNYTIEHFNFTEIDEKVRSSLLKNVEEYKVNIENFEKKAYDHIVQNKERNTLECFEFNKLYELSLLFRAFLEIIKNNSLPSDLLNSYNIVHEKRTRLVELEQLSFYVLQVRNKTTTTLYFKSFSINSLYLRKNILMKVREATKLRDLDEKYLNLDTNFDFYLSLPNNFIDYEENIDTQDVEVYIKNSSNFETILSFREIYDQHRDEVLNKLKEANIVKNMANFNSEFKLAKHRRKFTRISAEDQFDKVLEKFDDTLIHKFRNQTDDLEITKEEKGIMFEIKSKRGVDIFLDILGEHVLISFDDVLQQVLNKQEI